MHSPAPSREANQLLPLGARPRDRTEPSGFSGPHFHQVSLTCMARRGTRTTPVTRTGLEPAMAGLKIRLPHPRSTRRFGRLLLLLRLPGMEPLPGIEPGTFAIRMRTLTMRNGVASGPVPPIVWSAVSRLARQTVRLAPGIGFEPMMTFVARLTAACLSARPSRKKRRRFGVAASAYRERPAAREPSSAPSRHVEL